MYCRNCGRDIKDGTKFCPYCGGGQEITAISVIEPVRVNQGAGPGPSAGQSANSGFAHAKNNSKIKIPLLIILAVVAVAVIGVLIFVLLDKPLPMQGGSSNYIFSEKGIDFLSSTNKSHVVHPNGKIDIVDSDIYMVQGSLNETKGAFLSRDDRDNMLLYHASGNESVFVDRDQYIDAYLSADGNSIVYVTDLGNYAISEPATLNLYSGGESQIISRDHNYYGGGGVAISPDGKTIIFTADYNLDKDSYTTYIWENGKQNVLGDDMWPIAVSNGGKHIYYSDDGNVYVMENGSKIRLNNANAYTTYQFNCDFTSVLYSYEESGKSPKTFIYEGGGDRIQIDGYFYRMLVPTHVRSSYFSYLEGSSAINVKDFKDTFFASDSSIYYINSKYETHRVAKFDSDIQVAPDGKTVFFITSDSLYKINGTKPDSQREEVVGDDDVVSYRILGNGNELYYLNDYDELFYKKGKNKAELIGDVEYSEYRILESENRLLYIEDDELYYTKGAEKGTRVTGVYEDDMFFNSYYPLDRIFVGVSDGDEGVIYYMSSNGIDFKELGYN